MKKLLSITLISTMLFLFGCSKKEQCQISIDNFANAVPENTKLFAAYHIDKKFVEAGLSQNKIKEFLVELTKNKVVQDNLNKGLSKIKDDTKGIITQEFINKAFLEITTATDEFFLGSYVDDFSENSNVNIIIKSAPITKIAKEILDNAKEKSLLQSTQKDGSTIYKKDDFTILIKDNLIVISNKEENANLLLNNLKTPIEKSFAKTQSYAALKSIKENANLLFFIDIDKISDGNVANVLVSGKYNSITEGTATVKVNLGKNAIKDVIESFNIFSQKSLPNGGILKNSIADSTIAMGIAIPEISQNVVDFVNKFGNPDDPSIDMVLQMLKSVGLKNLYLSCGELNGEQILNFQETMQPPEMFLKIECENSEALFKDPTIAQMLNSPFISPMQVGETTIFTTMANVKFAPTNKNSLFISTITDLAKTISLAKNSGENLSSNKDATYILSKLPQGNQIEIFYDAKKLRDLAKTINEMQLSEMQNDTSLDVERIKIALTNFSGEITKKSVFASSVKFEKMFAEINMAFIQEIDFEKALKILKDLK